MARKSRKSWAKAQEQIQAEPEDKLIPTAVYCRLSVKNGGKNEDTLETQIELVTNYIAEHPQLELKEIYADNGYSGTNYKRPEFLRMMDDVRRGTIRCIVVKDLSRLGREYVETGHYIEDIFPYLNVRFIAVMDNFDNTRKEDMEGLAITLKNLVNDHYSRDISQKVWSVKQQQKMKGLSHGNCAPYGYIRNPETKQYEIDFETVRYVELIFQWALMGVSITETAKRLEMLDAPTPRMRQYELGGCYNPGTEHWSEATIRAMLQSRVYIGDTETNKTNKAFFRSQSKTLLPREEWVIVEHTHEPIVAADDFNMVQEIMAAKMERYIQTRRTDVKTMRDHLQGLVYCADCGKRDDFERLPRKGKHRSPYYICKGIYSRTTCSGHKISAPCLEKLVMDQVRQYVGEVCNIEKLKPSDSPLVAVGLKVTKLDAKTKGIMNKKQRLYEDYVSGNITAEEYEFYRNRYSSLLEQANRELNEAQKEQKEIKQQLEHLQGRVQKIREYISGVTFDEDFVRELIDRIEVSNNGSLSLTFRFPDVFRHIGEERAS